MTGFLQRHNGDKRTEKQIGCMSGFLQIFDRHQILAGKRIHSAKRLPPSAGVGASPETVSSGESHESDKHVVVVPASPDISQSSPAEKVTGRLKPPALVPTFERKNVTQQSSLISCKEMHRNSLDSKVTVSNTSVTDGDDNRRRSTSVVAKLMGLEPLSSSDEKTQQSAGKSALLRSASESRALGDRIYSKYIDDNNFQVKQPNKSQKQSVDFASGNLKSESSRTSPWRSRNFFDSTDCFPEPNQTTVTMHEDFEKKLKSKMIGMDEQCNDLSTLKQILEVLQLKGLLHSTTRSNRESQQNFVYDRNLHFNESSIIIVKPCRSSASEVDYQRSVNDSQRVRRFVTENSPAISPNRDGGAIDRSGSIPVRSTTSSPNRIESNLKTCNSISKTKPMRIEIRRRDNESSGSLKTSPIDSPKRNGSVQRSPRNQKSTESYSIHSPNQKFIKNSVTDYESSSIDSPNQKFTKNVVTDYESSSISENTVSTPSTTDSERSKWNGCIEGKSLLQRCDKLLHNITEMNNTTESPPSSATVLPSPVSVLDSGFDNDEPLTPSHSIDLKVYESATPAVEFKDDNAGFKLSPTKSTKIEEFTSNDSDFIYVSEIIRASQHLHEDSDLFFSIEKQFHTTENTSNASKHQRKLIFDVILEIINRNRQLPPWKALIEDSQASLKQIWNEFLKIRESNYTGDGVLELVSGVLKKDLVDINGWMDYPIEKLDLILNIERMIFKDLVCEAIGDLTEFSSECRFLRTRRRLVF